MVTAQQNREHQRGKGIRHEKRHQLKVDMPTRCLKKRHLDGGQLHKENREQEAKPGVYSERLRVIDPELHNRRHKDEQAQEEFLGRFILLTRKNQNGEPGNKCRQKQRPGEPSGL